MYKTNCYLQLLGNKIYGYRWYKILLGKLVNKKIYTNIVYRYVHYSYIIKNIHMLIQINDLIVVDLFISLFTNK